MCLLAGGDKTRTCAAYSTSGSFTGPVQTASTQYSGGFREHGKWAAGGV